MADSFLPSTDSGLMAWAQNFSTRINLSPVDFGLSLEEAAGFASLQAEYAARYDETSSLGTRSKALVAAKNNARAALKINARLLASIIRGQANVSVADKVLLGLTVRMSGPTPILAPAFAPSIQIVSTWGRTVKLRISDSQVARRGRPKYVAGALVFSFVGENPPADIKRWTLEGHTTETRFEIVFPPEVPSGAQIWCAGYWVSPRLERGPIANAATVHIPGGPTIAMTNTMPTRKAA